MDDGFGHNTDHRSRDSGTQGWISMLRYQLFFYGKWIQVLALMVICFQLCSKLIIGVRSSATMSILFQIYSRTIWNMDRGTNQKQEIQWVWGGGANISFVSTEQRMCNETYWVSKKSLLFSYIKLLCKNELYEHMVVEQFFNKAST